MGQLSWPFSGKKINVSRNCGAIIHSILDFAGAKKKVNYCRNPTSSGPIVFHVYKINAKFSCRLMNRLERPLIYCNCPNIGAK